MTKSTMAMTLRPLRRARSSWDTSTEPPSACSGVTVSTRREPAQAAAQVVSATIGSGQQQRGVDDGVFARRRGRAAGREQHPAGRERGAADEAEERADHADDEPLPCDLGAL